MKMMKSENFLFPILLIIVIGLFITIDPVYGDERFDEYIKNPVLKKYSDNILFYLSCDEKNDEAEMAAGNYKPRSKKGEFAFESGLFGSAIRCGEISFPGKNNVNFISPGTIIMWVSAFDWKPVKMGYYFPLRLYTGNGIVMIGRMGGQSFGRATVYAYAETRDKNGKKKKPASIHIYGAGDAKNWKNGEWHMIALSWNSRELKFSLDGNIYKQTKCDKFKDVNFFTVTAGHKPKPGYQVLLDEIVILDRPLDDKEIREIYDDTRIAAGIVKPSKK